jgi:hypothetical protein
MTMLRDLMLKDTTRRLRQSELAERLRYERQHAGPGEVVDVLHESDGPELAHCRAVLGGDWTPAPDVPDESDPVSALLPWGLPERDVNATERHAGTIAELRAALAEGRIQRWGQCGAGTVAAVAKSLARVDKAKR